MHNQNHDTHQVSACNFALLPMRDCARWPQHCGVSACAVVAVQALRRFLLVLHGYRGVGVVPWAWWDDLRRAKVSKADHPHSALSLSVSAGVCYVCVCAEEQRVMTMHLLARIFLL
jgi:hypothetical protein